MVEEKKEEENKAHTKTAPEFAVKNKKLALKLILTNDDEVCIPSLSSILLAVLQEEQVLLPLIKVLPPSSPIRITSKASQISM